MVPKERVDPSLALPRGRTVNVWVLIEAQNELLIRHEGVDDVTEFEVNGITVPGILNTKFQAVQRRQMLRTLYSFKDLHPEELDKLYSLAKKYNVSNAENLKDWKCYLTPGTPSKSKQQEEIMKGGYCTICPNCMIYGYVAGESGTYNVKSRVEGDAYFGLCPSKLCVTRRTFNAVDDVTKTTYMEGGTTGALFQLSLVEPGTLFVGKVALRDMSPAELLLVLHSIAKVDRIGGRVTHFGKVKVHVPAITFDYFEKGSGYEVAKALVGDKKVDLEEAINKVVEMAKGEVKITKRDLADELRNIEEGDLMETVKEAWRDAITFKASIEALIYGGKGR
ncbi:CRISPR-associated protein [Ignicoccus pacificus DSM 13166]|uniref:CRISPR-associated protein n=1 Tax=Ignicoccus pacificus DSM 13166 TaxID=940294 RepID=A0A977PKQ0_9CREN|nr:CRISPR-associated protein [Ignicoccus pacificus DSM 13166]